jgi:hypothetical protein
MSLTSIRNQIQPVKLLPDQWPGVATPEVVWHRQCGTLLSSQGSDAHRHRFRNRRQGNPTNLVFPYPPVKPPRGRPQKTRVSQSYPAKAHEAPTGSGWEGHPRVFAVALFSPPSSASLRAAWDNLRRGGGSSQTRGFRACRHSVTVRTVDGTHGTDVTGILHSPPRPSH